MTIYFTYNSRFGVPGSNDPPRILSRDAVDVKCFFKFSGLMRGENIKTRVAAPTACATAILVPL